MLALRLGWRIFQEFKARSKIAEIILHVYTLESHEPNLVFFAYLLCLATFKKVVELVVTLLQFVVLYLQAIDEAVGTLLGLLKDRLRRPRVVGAAVRVGVLHVITFTPFVVVLVLTSVTFLNCGQFVHRFGLNLFCSDVSFHCFIVLCLP